MTLPSPDVLPAEPVPNPLAGFPGEAAYVHPRDAERTEALAMLAQGFAGGGFRSVGRGGAGRANSVGVRYNTADEPLRSPAIGDAPQPAAAPVPAAPAPAPPRATMDPEGRHLTAPRIFGRDANGQVLAHSPGDVGSLLDALAGRGVSRNVPKGDMPPGTRGEVRLVPRLFGAGEDARLAARALIREGEPYGGLIEGHEIGHLTHLIRDGASRLTRRAETELGRLYSEGDYRTGTTLARDELYAHGVGAYTYGGEPTRTLLSRAPNAAALFRDHINTHPVLSRYFQANSLLPAVMVGGAAMGLLGEPQDEDVMP
ncbi:hypothetical protein [Plastoroseomonas hellenica]|uniref:hypothetical protein n=1 Tax=Plastoroseomonas hellenica TaxID=2687306 RepID=UPI001BA9AE71|nr:hypothetical protein [Plastoroseomonas hellenica]MBR0647717.1 hypothetical protein [Plastoroseomonas hellenica]